MRDGLLYDETADARRSRFGSVPMAVQFLEEYGSNVGEDFYTVDLGALLDSTPLHELPALTENGRIDSQDFQEMLNRGDMFGYFQDPERGEVGPSVLRTASIRSEVVDEFSAEVSDEVAARNASAYRGYLQERVDDSENDLETVRAGLSKLGEVLEAATGFAKADLEAAASQVLSRFDVREAGIGEERAPRWARPVEISEQERDIAAASGRNVTAYSLIEGGNLLGTDPESGEVTEFEPDLSVDYGDRGKSLFFRSDDGATVLLVEDPDDGSLHLDTDIREMVYPARAECIEDAAKGEAKVEFASPAAREAIADAGKTRPAERDQAPLHVADLIDGKRLDELAREADSPIAPLGPDQIADSPEAEGEQLSGDVDGLDSLAREIADIDSEYGDPYERMDQFDTTDTTEQVIDYFKDYILTDPSGLMDNLREVVPEGAVDLDALGRRVLDASRGSARPLSELDQTELLHQAYLASRKLSQDGPDGATENRYSDLMTALEDRSGMGGLEEQVKDLEKEVADLKQQLAHSIQGVTKDDVQEVYQYIYEIPDEAAEKIARSVNQSLSQSDDVFESELDSEVAAAAERGEIAPASMENYYEHLELLASSGALDDKKKEGSNYNSGDNFGDGNGDTARTHAGGRDR